MPIVVCCYANIIPEDATTFDPGVEPQRFRTVRSSRDGNTIVGMRQCCHRHPSLPGTGVLEAQQHATGQEQRREHGAERDEQ
jgi:hypothetical protein